MWKRIQWRWRRRQEEKELDEEIQSHLEMEAREHARAGASASEAEAAARRAFGNRTRIAEQTREVWGLGWMEELGRDLRYGARALRRTPGFTLVWGLTLALGSAPTPPSSAWLRRFCWNRWPTRSLEGSWPSRHCGPRRITPETSPAATTPIWLPNLRPSLPRHDTQAARCRLKLVARPSSSQRTARMPVLRTSFN